MMELHPHRSGDDALLCSHTAVVVVVVAVALHWPGFLQSHQQAAAGFPAGNQSNQ